MLCKELREKVNYGWTIIKIIKKENDELYLKDVLILKNEKLSEEIYKLTFKDKEISQKSKMGQFLEIKAGQGIDNLLRKPISINNVIEDEITLLYKVVGNGTEKLSKYKKDDKISVLGPLGNGFPEIENKEVLLVAGGIGYGPFSYVMQKIKDWKLFYGVRDKKELVLDEYMRYEKEGKAILLTDNGSYGKKGYITVELEEYLKSNKKDKVIFCCGPEIMMKKVSEIANMYSVPAYLSLETYMGCGIGACLGCAQKIKNKNREKGWEYKKVCKDGPVFKADEVIWE